MGGSTLKLLTGAFLTLFLAGDHDCLRLVRGRLLGVDGLGAKIVFFGAASNIALTSPSSWKEFNISKVASDDGLSIELERLTTRNGNL